MHAKLHYLTLLPASSSASARPTSPPTPAPVRVRSPSGPPHVPARVAVLKNPWMVEVVMESEQPAGSVLEAPVEKLNGRALEWLPANTHEDSPLSLKGVGAVPARAVYVPSWKVTPPHPSWAQHHACAGGSVDHPPVGAPGAKAARNVPGCSVYGHEAGGAGDGDEGGATSWARLAAAVAHSAAEAIACAHVLSTHVVGACNTHACDTHTRNPSQSA